MAESHVISGLVAKRSELSGLILHHQETVRQLSIAIGNIDGAIKLFDPDYDLRTIKSKALKLENPWFEHGETGRMILDVLRLSASPLSTRQIGEAMIAAKCVNVDGKEMNLIMKVVLGAAQRLAKKGVIAMVGRTAPEGNGRGRMTMVWQLV